MRWAQTAGRPTSFSFRTAHIPLCPHVHPSRSPLSLARWAHASGAFLPRESRSRHPELSAMADLLAVEPAPPWTQSSRSYPSDFGASLGYKSGAVPRRGDRPLRRAQGDASEIHGEETPLTSGSHPPVARRKLMHARGWRPGPTRQQQCGGHRGTPVWLTDGVMVSAPGRCGRLGRQGNRIVGPK